MISLVAGTPDTDATVARLLRNQRDIGNAFAPFYGRAAGAALTRELRRHILIAADVIAAAKAGDQARLAAEQTRWGANAADIAALLSRANPRHWKRAALPTLAIVLAADARYDLHALIELVERGCAPELAVRILAPLGGEPAA